MCEEAYVIGKTQPKLKRTDKNNFRVAGPLRLKLGCRCFVSVRPAKGLELLKRDNFRLENFLMTQSLCLGLSHF